MQSKFPQPKPAEVTQVVQDAKAFMASIYADFEKLKQKSEQDKDDNLVKMLKRKQAEKTEATDEPARNKFAALTRRSMKNIHLKAKQAIHSVKITSSQQIVWTLILNGLKVAKSIKSCDLPTDKPSDSALVKTVQLHADEILNSDKIPWLRKILEIAIDCKSIGYGNCQEKAFFAFAYMLKISASKENGIHSLRLASFLNHFILIVNEEFLMDPWLNLAFPITQKNISEIVDYVFDGFGELIDYYTINSEGACYTHEVREGQESSRDVASEKELPACMKWLESQREHFLTETEKSLFNNVLSQSAKQDSLNTNRLWSVKSVTESEYESKENLHSTHSHY